MKNCWIICGPESSGSVFIAKTISFATGHCEFFGQYSGHGFNSDSPCENLVLHRSLPYGRHKKGRSAKFQDSLLEEIAEFSEKYERVNFILTTRDKNCSILSKSRRFGVNIDDANEDYAIAAPFFERLVNDDHCFIWNYESMLLFGRPYFLRMYRFFGIESDFTPEVYDGNAPHVMKGHFRNPFKRIFTASRKAIQRIKQK